MSETISKPKNFDSAEFIKFVEDSTPKNSRLLGRAALNSALAVMHAQKQLETAQKLDSPYFVQKNVEGILDNKIDKYIKGDYDVEKDVREPLAKAPFFVKHMQNETFDLLTWDEGDNFIRRVVDPKKYYIKNDHGSPFNSFDQRPQEYYDFIGKITEKNENGKYTIPDETVKNIVSWYQSQIAKKSKEIFDENNVYDINYYKHDLCLATNHGLLPKEFEKKAKLLNGNSEDSISIKYGVLDAISGYEEGLGHFFMTGGECEGSLFNREKTIKLNINLLLDYKNEDGLDLNYDTLVTFYHELTHAISGDEIDFNGNKKANTIFNEALTVSITNCILKAIDFEDEDPENTIDDVDPFNEESNSYKVEREVLRYLSSGGEKNITPTEFYMAYIETDKNYESIRNSNLEEYEKLNAFRNHPYRTYGPNQQKLINDLLESFPECKNLAGLGKMIVKKFTEFKEKF